jgi:hypothetical protein
MTHIILFAIIGAELEAGAWYWIVYAAHIILFMIKTIVETFKEMM